jgi:UDP-N-acetylmuramoyl-tripeptide--D-alanyl-D-alanine ligase
MKNIKLTIEDIFGLPTAEIINPDGFRPLTSVSTDTRSIRKNSLFVAIKGKNFDGHHFIEEAVKKGAAAVVVNKAAVKKLGEINVPVIAVKNTVNALGDIASIWRSKFTGKVIGITGSNGKTTTKEILAALLSAKYKVRKTEANNNNHIGAPLTILSADNSYDVIVLELGTNHFGEIPYTAKIARPDFALITNIGDSHLEFLKNREGVYSEKAALFEAALKNGGKIFVNADDKIIARNTKKIERKTAFGFGPGSDVQGVIKGKTEEGKSVVEINAGKTSFETVLPLYGTHNAYNFLAAVTVALSAGLSASAIKGAVKNIKAVAKRLDVKNYKNVMLIDDTYNANPLSMKSAIDLLKDITKYKRKIVLLGDMFELGGDAVKLHEALAANIKKSGVTEVYTIGRLMKNLDAKLEKSKTVHKHFSGRKALASFIMKHDLNDSVILAKGSRGMKMEEFVKVIEERFIR